MQNRRQGELANFFNQEVERQEAVTKTIKGQINAQLF